MPTSQLETHPFSFRSPPHLRCIARPLPPPPQPPSPYIPFPYCLQHGHSCHCIEKYHAPINHLQHRTLYQRTIRERWEGGRVHRSGILATGTSVEGWSRVSGVGRWPVTGGQIRLLHEIENRRSIILFTARRILRRRKNRISFNFLLEEIFALKGREGERRENRMTSD